MNELLLILVMGLYSACNQRHDALNSGAYKWPFSGWRLCWDRSLRSLVLHQHGVWVAVGFDESVEEGWLVVLKTLDRWHLWKWAMFYICPVYILSLCIWPQLVPSPWAFIPATALATVIWKALPQPEHWK